jgi:hypothetical protein
MIHKDLARYRSEKHMDAFNEIISRLEKQKEAIDKALEALRQVDAGTETPAPVAIVSEAAPAKRSYVRRAAKKKSGGISAEGRKRLADAMKKRWAAKRAGPAVKAVKKAGRKKSAKAA